VHWDVDELESKKEEIVQGDKAEIQDGSMMNYLSIEPPS
jgi:hypothetical protein